MPNTDAERIEITPFTICTVAADISRGTWRVTWGTLCWEMLGAKNPLLGAIKDTLARGETYDLAGIAISTKGETAKYHTKERV